MKSVELIRLEKRHGNKTILHGIDLEIHQGEFIVLVGPSGCGKSTALRTIAGLEEVSSGTLKINGNVVNEVPPKDRGIAMVFQNYALYPHMSVYDNMAFGLKLQKLNTNEIQKRVHEAAIMLELDDLLQRKPSELSGGQRQRVAMGRAIVRQSPIFLFDEPLSNLDAQLRTHMRMEIKKLHLKLGTTTIYVTHDQVEAMTLADRIVIMREGVIQQIGSPTEVFETPNNMFVAGFIGSPKMNIFPANVEQSTDNLFLKANQLHLPISENLKEDLQSRSNVCVGIRPNDISLQDDLADVPAEWIHDAEVQFAETLGAKSLVEIKVGGNLLLAELEGRTMPRPGEHLKVVLHLNHLHVFDATSEKRIGG